MNSAQQKKKKKQQQQINQNYIRTVHHKFNTNQWLDILPIRGTMGASRVQITHYQGALQWIIDNKMSSACRSIGYRRVGEDTKYLLTNYITMKITYNYSATGCGSTNCSNYIIKQNSVDQTNKKKQEFTNSRPGWAHMYFP